MTGKIKIELQYFTGCPNSKEMIRRVKESFKGNENRIDYFEILVEDIESAKKINFRGSPTLLINGIDIENMPEQATSSLSCRIYKNGLPAIDDIKIRIESMLRSTRIYF